jgi:DNA polymerase-3 subunit delta'
MEQLLQRTTAYKIFDNDRKYGSLSHAYMLFFCDQLNLRYALKLFALKLFDAPKDSRDGRLIMSENFSDLKIYPKPDKKLSVADASEIIDDCALKPIERDKKLYIISDFDTSAQLFQNKLLKVLEEPPEGVYFLLGATTLSPVLDTIRSRVKMLEIPPFSTDEVYEALCRMGDNSLNRQAAESSAGILGVAQNMLADGWYEEVHSTAQKICAVDNLAKAGEVATQYGDFKYKPQLLTEMQQIYFEQLRELAMGKESNGLSKNALVYAIESLDKAMSDIKFNANFPSLLYDFLIRVVIKNQE